MATKPPTPAEVAEGVVGAAGMLLALATPFLRGERSHWGLPADLSDWRWPGDELVPEPRWQWTHGIEIDAPLHEVWPWVAQLGQGRAGFYSYRFLENVAGCELDDVQDVHEEWQHLDVGDGLRLHPDMPALPVHSLEQGHWFCCFAGSDLDAPEAALPPGDGERPPRWLQVSWLFHLEPLPDRRTRFVSRYRCACSDDLPTRLQFGQGLMEPVGFVMDRRMLLGVKERAERAERLARGG